MRWIKLDLSIILMAWVTFIWTTGSTGNKKKNIIGKISGWFLFINFILVSFLVIWNI